MKYKEFDVVELNDQNKATILKVDGNQYFVEVVNVYGIKVDNRYITDTEINQAIYSRKKERQR